MEKEKDARDQARKRERSPSEPADHNSDYRRMPNNPNVKQRVHPPPRTASISPPMHQPPFPRANAATSRIQTPIGGTLAGAWRVPTAPRGPTAAGGGGGDGAGAMPENEEVAERLFRHISQQMLLEAQPVFSFLELLLVELGEGYTMDQLVRVTASDLMWQRGQEKRGRTVPRQTRTVPFPTDPPQPPQFDSNVIAEQLLERIIELAQALGDQPAALDRIMELLDWLKTMDAKEIKPDDDTNVKEEKPGFLGAMLVGTPAAAVVPARDALHHAHRHWSRRTANGLLRTSTSTTMMVGAGFGLNPTTMGRGAASSSTMAMLVLTERTRGAIIAATSELQTVLGPVAQRWTPEMYMFSPEVSHAFAKWVTTIYQRTAGARGLGIDDNLPLGTQVLYHASPGGRGRRQPTRYNIIAAHQELEAGKQFFMHVRRAANGLLVYRPPRQQNELARSGNAGWRPTKQPRLIAPAGTMMFM